MALFPRRVLGQVRLARGDVNDRRQRRKVARSASCAMKRRGHSVRLREEGGRRRRRRRSLKGKTRGEDLEAEWSVARSLVSAGEAARGRREEEQRQQPPVWPVVDNRRISLVSGAQSAFPDCQREDHGGNVLSATWSRVSGRHGNLAILRCFPCITQARNGKV